MKIYNALALIFKYQWETVEAYASDLSYPVDVTWHEEILYISHRSRYSTLDPETGEFKTIINGLPSWCEFLNAKPVFDSHPGFVYRYNPDGGLITTQNSADPMTPRGIRLDTEPIYEVKEGLWHGQPDYCIGIPVTDPRFMVLDGPQAFVLKDETHEKLLQGEPLPPQSIARLQIHSAAEGMVFGRQVFGLAPVSEILIAEMGSIVPMYKAESRPPSSMPGQGQPASAPNGGGLERPIRLE